MEGSKKNENSKPSLWKDASLFAKAEDVKTNTIANGKTLRPSNTTAVAKPPTLVKNGPIQLKSPQINTRKSQQILSTKKSKPVGMVSPRVPNRKLDETQQAVTADAVSTPANDVEIQSTPEPRENESTSRPNNEVSSSLHVLDRDSRMYIFV